MSFILQHWHILLACICGLVNQRRRSVDSSSIPITVVYRLSDHLLRLDGVSSASAAGWGKLFDGKALDGWIQKNGTAKYHVVDGTIHGTTNEGSPNSFLFSEKEWGYFQPGKYCNGFGF